MAKRYRQTGRSRRAFLKGAALCGSLAVARLGLAQNAATCPARTAVPGGIPAAGGALLPIGEIRRGNDGILRATILVEDEERSLWVVQPNTISEPGYRAIECREKQAMRYFAGSAEGK